MRTQDFVRAAAGVLAGALAAAGLAFAQTQQPEPATMVDTAPTPAQDRASMGAVIVMDQPVLAQRQQMQAAQERSPDTRTLGAGPARVLRRALTPEEQQIQRAFEESERQQKGVRD